MSIINNFLEKITGLDLDGSDKAAAERPCANCPSNCSIAGEACSLCEPYKKRLIDAVYHVDHIDEFRAQYEVVGAGKAASATGTVICPRCGGPSANHAICDYCGAKLSDEPVSSGKIQVAAASDIPNPIMDVQNIIYERYDAIVNKFTSQKSSGSLISSLFAELLSVSDENGVESALGAKMSESEIKEAAALYKVSVGEYLTGLDNGKYLNLSAKKQADKQGESTFSPAAAGMAGMAGIGMFASELMSESGRKRPYDMPQRPAQQWGSPRPAQRSDPNPAQSGARPVRPGKQIPEQGRVRPSQSDERRSPEPSRSRPSRSDESRPQRQQGGSSDRWKERDPSRRRG